jgi:hypothetical protein
MFCGKCGFENSDDTVVCNNCGEFLSEISVAKSVADEQPAYQASAQPTYQAPAQPVYQAPAQQSYAYQSPVQTPYQAPYQTPYQAPVQQVIPEGYSETVSVGDWVGSMLLMCIPIVGFILMLVWAFGGAKKSKSNYFKACLLISLISVGISLICLLLFGVLLGNL